MIWLACYTGSRQETLADHFLRAAGYETLYLHYREPRRHARTPDTVIRPYFARYLFIALDPAQGLYGAASCQGVNSIVSCGGVPEEIPAEVIEELRKRGDKNGLVKLTPEERKLRKRLQRGDKVLMYPGSLTELIGTVILDTGSAVSAWANGKKWRVPVHNVAAANG